MRLANRLSDAEVMFLIVGPNPEPAAWDRLRNQRLVLEVVFSPQQDAERATAANRVF
jgi:hypothetical protein